MVKGPTSLPGLPRRRQRAVNQESFARLRVYLSYRQEDEAYVRRLHADLRELDINTLLLDAGSLGSIDRLTREFGPPPRDSAEVLLLVLGPAYYGGGGLTVHQSSAIAWVLARGGQIIPVLVGARRGPVELPRILNEAARLRAVNLEDESWDRSLQELQTAITSAAAQRPTPRPNLKVSPVDLLPEERNFVNRTVELRRLLEFFEQTLDQAGDAAPPVALIIGVGGIGKSALAVRAAHLLRERFPDGQLYASLGEAAAGAQVLRQFLVAFGLDPHDLPESVDGLAELYQSMLAGRRILVVLDDIAAAEHPELLVPNDASCAALLTSRRLEFPASFVVTLDRGLPESDAVKLLRQTADASIVENPEMVELVRMVGGNPLSLQLAATLLREPGAIDSLRPLARLEDPTQVRRILLERAVQHLPDDRGRRLFPLLGVLPMPEFEPGLAAALAGIELDEANAWLRLLVDSVLLEPSGEDRYRLGALVSEFAAELAAEVPEGERREALARAIRWIAVRTAYQPLAPITRDYWTADDTLGYGQYADAITAFIRHKETRPPLTIGVKAPWGAGKTSLMRMVQERLDPRANRTTWKPISLELTSDSREMLAPGRAADAQAQVTNREVLQRATEPPADVEGADPGQLDVEPPTTLRLQTQHDWRPTVWFNPWIYQSGEQIWAGLAYEIITQVTDRLAPGDRERFWLALNLRRIDGQAVRRRVYRLLVERFLPWLLGLALATVIALVAVLVALVLSAAAGIMRAIAAGLLSLAGTSFGVGAVITAARFLREKAAGPFASLVRTPDLVTGSRDLAGQTARSTLSDLFPDPGYEARLGFLHLVQTDMRRVLDLIATERRPLVVFVDDLDRCSPSAVAQVIEAINLFLAGEFPNCIFVLAMDPAVVAAHVEAVHKDLADHLPTSRLAGERSTLGWHFLEKIVQLPLSLPPPDPTDRMPRYIGSLLDAPPDEAAQRPTFEKHQPTATAAPTAQSNAQSIATRPGSDSTVGAADQDVEAEVARAERISQLEMAIRRRSPTAESLSTAALEAQKEVLGATAGQLRSETQEAANRVFVELYSDAEARAAVVDGVPGLASDNPREIKRFVNLFRFYTFIAQQDRLQGRSAADAAEIAKLAVMAIRWPSMLDAFGQTLGGKGATVLARLEQEAQAAAAQGEAADDRWRSTLAQTGLVPEGEEALRSHQAWAQQLREFLETKPGIADVAKRML